MTNRRDLTDEEMSRPITWERIRDYHYCVGEDFLDQGSEGCGLIFAGYMLGIRPQDSKEILQVVNDSNRRCDIQDFMELYGYCEKGDIDELYYYFADFCNLTENTKRLVNERLIWTEEYYD